MKSTDQGHAPPGMPLAPQAGNGLGGGEQSLCGSRLPGRRSPPDAMASSCRNRNWEQVCDLVRKRGPVVGRAALHDISIYRLLHA